jgi:hypothetical protein
MVKFCRPKCKYWMCFARHHIIAKARVKNEDLVKDLIRNEYVSKYLSTLGSRGLSRERCIRGDWIFGLWVSMFELAQVRLQLCHFPLNARAIG